MFPARAEIVTLGNTQKQCDFYIKTAASRPQSFSVGSEPPSQRVCTNRTRPIFVIRYCTRLRTHAHARTRAVLFPVQL